MRIETIRTGDEVLTGEITNANFRYMARFSLTPGFRRVIRRMFEEADSVRRWPSRSVIGPCRTDS